MKKPTYFPKYFFQKLVYLIVGILFFSCSEKKHNDLEKEGLFGNVKTVREKKYKILEEVSKITKTIIDDRLATFNKNGYNTELLTWGNKCNYRLQRVFDNEGKCIIQIWESTDDMYTKDTLIYKNNMLFEKRIQLKDNTLIGKEMHYYDHQKNNTKIISYSEKREVLETIKNYFDDSGYKIKIEVFNDKDALIESKIYRYDGEGNEIHFSSYDSNNNLIKQETSVYDDKNFIIKLNTFTSKNTLKEECVFEYEYDEVGNWIKRIDFINNKKKHIIEREITYY